MNKYIYSVSDLDSFKVEYYLIVAKDLMSAKDKIISKYFNEYEWDCPDEWRDFIRFGIEEMGTLIGDPKDIETF